MDKTQVTDGDVICGLCERERWVTKHAEIVPRRPARIYRIRSLSDRECCTDCFHILSEIRDSVFFGSDSRDAWSFFEDIGFRIHGERVIRAIVRDDPRPVFRYLREFPGVGEAWCAAVVELGSRQLEAILSAEARRARALGQP
jgi:hypothetical protein